MKKTFKPKKLNLDKTTLRVLTKHDLQDVVGGTSGQCYSPDIKCSQTMCLSQEC